MAPGPREIAWESAVVVRVPTLDQTIGELRRRFDLPRKPNGIRPHVTVLIPFLPAAELGEEGALPALRELCAGLKPFDVSFSRTARFPRVLYLAPDPPEPFMALTTALRTRWPQCQPYAGEPKQVIPHLTVTTGRSRRVLDAVDAALAPQLPVEARIGAAQVYLFDGHRWTELAALPLGSRAG